MLRGGLLYVYASELCDVLSVRRGSLSFLVFFFVSLFGAQRVLQGVVRGRRRVCIRDSQRGGRRARASGSVRLVAP